MQTRTQILKLLTPPDRNTVEWKVIFTREDWERGVELCKSLGDPIMRPLSEETTLADCLQDLQMIMFRLEQSKEGINYRG